MDGTKETLTFEWRASIASSVVQRWQCWRADHDRVDLLERYDLNMALVKYQKW